MPRGQKCWRCHAKPCCQWWGPNPSQRRCWPYFSFARGRVDSTWPGMVCPWCSCSSAFPRLAQPPVRNWWMTLGTFPWGVMASFLQWFLQWHQEPLRRPLCQFWKNAHLPLINYIRKFHQIPTYHIPTIKLITNYLYIPKPLPLAQPARFQNSHSHSPGICGWHCPDTPGRRPQFPLG